MSFRSRSYAWPVGLLACHALACALLVRCTSSPSVMDAGAFDAPPCEGSPFSCYTSCTDLTPSSTSTCMNNAWQCPSTDCACSQHGTAQIVCASCADASVLTFQVCDAASGYYECPSGTGVSGSCSSPDASSDAPADAPTDAPPDSD